MGRIELPCNHYGFAQFSRTLTNAQTIKAMIVQQAKTNILVGVNKAVKRLPADSCFPELGSYLV